jgi:hypothetical protein
VSSPRHSKLWIWFFSFLLLVIVATLSIPFFLSSRPGIDWLCKQIEKHTGGKITIGSASFSFLGPQEISDCRCDLPNQQFTFSADHALSTASLFDLLLKYHFGTLTMESPHLLFEESVAHLFTSDPWLKSGFLGQAGLSWSAKQYRGHLIVKEGQISSKAPQLKNLSIHDIDLDMEIEKTIKVSLTASAVDAEKKGDIRLQGIFSSPTSTSFHITMQHLPTAGLDHLTTFAFPEYKGILTALAGPLLDMHAEVTLEGNQGSIQLSCNSEGVQIECEGRLKNREFLFEKPAAVALKLAPELFTLLSKKIPTLQTLALSDPASFKLLISSFTFPFPWRKGIADSAFNLEASLVEPVTGISHGVPFTIDKAVFSVDTPAVAKEFAATADVLVLIKGKPGTLHLACNLSSLLSDNPEGQVTAELQQFPLFLMQFFDIDAEHFLGEYANMSLSFSLSKSNPQGVFSWESERLHIPDTTLLLGTTWTLAHPITISYDPALSPFSALSKVAPMQGTIRSFAFSFKDPGSIDLDATFVCDEVLFRGPLAQPVRNLSVDVALKGIQSIGMTLKSDVMQGSIQGSLDTKQRLFRFTNPILFDYIATSKQFVYLSAPCPIKVSIDPIAIPLANLSFDGLKGQISIPSIPLETESQHITLQNSKAYFQWNEAMGKIDMRLHSEIQGQPNSSITGQIGCFPLAEDKKTLSFEQAKVEGGLLFQKFSSTFLSVLCGMPAIPAMIGTSFDADLNFYSLPKEGHFNINFSSQHFKGNTSWEMSEKGFVLKTPTTLQWTFTPDAYRYLTNVTSSVPIQNIPITLLLSKCILPVQVPTKIETLNQRIFSLSGAWAPLEILCHFSMKALQVQNANDTMTLPELKMTLIKEQGASTLQFSADAVVTAQKEGTFNASFDMTPLDNTFDWKQTHTTLKIHAKQFPSEILDFFSASLGSKKTPFSSLCGPSVHVAIDAELENLNGSISSLFHSPQAEIEMKGRLNDGTLTLEAPLHAQLSLTEKASSFLLGEVNPLNLSAIYTQNPVTLDIPVQGVSLPIYPFAEDKIVVPKARIELGKVVCKNEGNVNTALSLLKSSSQDKDLHLWFAPIDFSIQGGVAKIERTEFLVANTFDLCLFGSVDFVKDWVDMTLGLTAQALSKAFGITKLPENYVLIIPMKGKMDDVRIDTGKATAKVALLLAWQHNIVSGAVGGTAGAFAGALVGALATLPDANANVPPPKHPFPWEVGQEKKPMKKSKKKTFKTTDRPSKQIMKVL